MPFFPDAQDGLDLLRTLTDELSVPVVAMSLSSAPHLDALAAGASEFLIKDGFADRLLVALRRASHSRSRQPTGSRGRHLPRPRRPADGRPTGSTDLTPNPPGATNAADGRDGPTDPPGLVADRP
jgi:DNA-binding NarL/FixJ family response regulator